jgi:hypothetical protein
MNTVSKISPRLGRTPGDWRGLSVSTLCWGVMRVVEFITNATGVKRK